MRRRILLPWAWLWTAILAGCAGAEPSRGTPEAIAHNERGAAAMARGDYEEAAREFDLAVARDEKFTLGRSNRGMAQHHLGRSQRGIEDCLRAIEGGRDLANP